MRRTSVTLILATALGLALRVYQLSRPGYLLGVTEYDDAVDLGSAIRLVHGALPYRDFVLVQPPGISLLMSPVALLTKAANTSTALVVARVLTAFAGAASITVAGLLVRHRGILVTAIVCGLLAVYPGAIEAAHTVLLEPWLVLFCLLGALAVFDGDQLARNGRRLVWGGVAFGFAGAIKAWALLPVIVILVVSLRQLTRRAWLTYLGGVVAGFALPVLPFFLLAPGAFYRDVVVAQLSRVDVTRVPVTTRLAGLAGLSYFSPVARGIALLVGLVIAALVVACSVGAWLRTRRSPPPLERFALGSTALVLVAFLWPADFYSHYAAFFVPFLALSIALPLGRLLGPLDGDRSGARMPAVRFSTALTALAVVAIVAMAGVAVDHVSKLSAGNPSAAAQRQIRAGACVLTDLTALTIVSDRFVSETPGCSPMIDPIGTDYALSRGRNGVSGAGRTPAVVSTWLNAFRHAQYVWLQCAPAAAPSCNPWTNRRIPWTPAILGYFRAMFRPVPGNGRVPHIFVRANAA